MCRSPSSPSRGPTPGRISLLSTWAAMLCLSTAALVAQEGADPHLKLNSLYRELREKGIDLSAKVRQVLPEPSMADGLDQAKQEAILAKLAGDVPLEEITRPAVVAPYVLKVDDVATMDADRLGRSAHVWFVAHGDFAKLTHENLRPLFQGHRKGTVLTKLTEQDLDERKLSRPKSAEKKAAAPKAGDAKSGDGDIEESYYHVTIPVLDKVQLRGGYHTVATRTADSIVIAARLDPAFARDAKFPNDWSPLTPKEDGTLVAGAPQPYDGAASYVRVTRLAAPKGALFVESHQLFVEHARWFTAPNFLRSKLPLVVQSDVRAFRRDLKKLTESN